METITSFCEKGFYEGRKTVAVKKNKDNKKAKKGDRFLITINVLGSSGPIRFVVDRDDNAAGVIKTALKLYAHEGRLPVLGSDINNVVLYPADAVSNAMKPSEAIGSCEVRNFVLCKTREDVIDRKGNGWRVWLQKSLILNLLSH
ncbi:hypothetical protein ACJIZ3_014596 [Penstemon smallii]|uniref:DUF7054 domain-containing protein n=1 Tax=Penstemon smallii TaxID=265156 RepID=A0ABD3RKC9_9LAMI